MFFPASRSILSNCFVYTVHFNFFPSDRCVTLYVILKQRIISLDVPIVSKTLAITIFVIVDARETLRMAVAVG